MTQIDADAPPTLMGEEVPDVAPPSPYVSAKFIMKTTSEKVNVSRNLIASPSRTLVSNDGIITPIRTASPTFRLTSPTMSMVSQIGPQSAARQVTSQVSAKRREKVVHTKKTHKPPPTEADPHPPPKAISSKFPRYGKFYDSQCDFVKFTETTEVIAPNSRNALKEQEQVLKKYLQLANDEVTRMLKEEESLKKLNADLKVRVEELTSALESRIVSLPLISLAESVKRVARPFIGVDVVDAEGGSVIVARVLENGPADLANVKVGDTVLMWDGAVVTNVKDLEAMIINSEVAAQHSLTVQHMHGLANTVRIVMKCTVLRDRGSQSEVKIAPKVLSHHLNVAFKKVEKEAISL